VGRDDRSGVEDVFKQRVERGTPDYWDYATLLELVVLAKDETAASEALSRSLAAIREAWEPETTLRNLRLIREARERRGEIIPSYITEIEAELAKHI
jgi:hypothetical protein